MFKNVKTRTIIFSLLIGVIIVGLLGGFYLIMIKDLIQIANETENIVGIIDKANIIKNLTEISIVVSIIILV